MFFLCVTNLYSISMPTWLRNNRGELFFFAAFTVVMTTDLRQPVLSTMQRGLLATGLWRATPPQRPATLPVRFASVRAEYPHPLPLYTLAGHPANLRVGARPAWPKCQACKRFTKKRIRRK
jgi:hypothetical protein